MSQHPEQELVAAWALGAVSDDERKQVAAHLETCEQCRAEARDMEEVSGLLAHAVPDAEPAAGLKQRVLAEARRVRPFRADRRSTPAWLAAAAVLIALGATLAAWRVQTHARTTDAQLAAARAELAARDSTLALLQGVQVHMVSLAAPGGRPAARVWWVHDRSVFVVAGFGLQPAPAGREYQLWAIADGHAPVSMGTFNTDATGRAFTTLPVAASILELGTVKLCAITEEPTGGSPQPTETPRMVGSWVHSD